VNTGNIIDQKQVCPIPVEILLTPLHFLVTHFEAKFKSNGDKTYDYFESFRTADAAEKYFVFL
jgi:hypothetical protein